jgi:hypothetical protein
MNNEAALADGLETSNSTAHQRTEGDGHQTMSRLIATAEKRDYAHSMELAAAWVTRDGWRFDGDIFEDLIQDWPWLTSEDRDELRSYRQRRLRST